VYSLSPGMYPERNAWPAASQCEYTTRPVLPRNIYLDATAGAPSLRNIYNFCGETWRKETTWKTYEKYEDILKHIQKWFKLHNKLENAQCLAQPTYVNSCLCNVRQKLLVWTAICVTFGRTYLCEQLFVQCSAEPTYVNSCLCNVRQNLLMWTAVWTRTNKTTNR
jgi:hypothetical protein